MNKHDVYNHINEPYLKIVKYFKTSPLKNNIMILKLLHKHHLNIEVESNIVNLNYDFPYETCNKYEKLEIRKKIFKLNATMNTKVKMFFMTCH
jgi:hypothetical protein